MECFNFLKCFYTTTTSSDGGITTTSTICYCGICFNNLKHKK